MALIPHSQWKAMSLLAAILLSGAVIWSMGKGSLLMALGLVAAINMALATLAHPLQQLRKLKDNGASRALFDRMHLLSLSYWGMIVAHCGVAVFVAGVTLVKTYESERDLVMQPCQTERIGPWGLSFIGVDQVPSPNYMAAHSVFELTRGEGRLIELVEP